MFSTFCQGTVFYYLHSKGSLATGRELQAGTRGATTSADRNAMTKGRCPALERPRQPGEVWVQGNDRKVVTAATTGFRHC